MMSRSRAWKMVAVLFLGVNIAGAVVALVAGELQHTGVHVLLIVITAGLMWRLFPRRGAQRGSLGDTMAHAHSAPELGDRLTHLEQSVDAVAVEVERIGEGQRFMTRLFTDNEASGASGAGGVKPKEVHVPLAPPARS